MIIFKNIINKKLLFKYFCSFRNYYKTLHKEDNEKLLSELQAMGLAKVNWCSCDKNDSI